MHQDKRGYLYRTWREAGQVRRQYVGKSEWARLWNEVEQSRAQEKQRLKVATRELMAREEELEERVCEFSSRVEAWRRLVLLHNGFRQHKRGEWRRQRRNKVKAIEKADEAENKQLNQQVEEALTELMTQASQDREAAQKFLALAESGGWLDGYLTTVADLGTRAQAEIIKKVVPDGDPLSVAAFAKKIERMNAELSGPAPSELEKQLAQRIVLEWLLLTYFEANLTLNLESEKWAAFYEKRVESAQRRYLSSLKTLAHIRKLQLPNLQINVARNQINAQINE